MHGVPSEASDIDAVIEEEVSIEAVVVPHFLVLLGLEIFFKVVYEA